MMRMVFTTFDIRCMTRCVSACALLAMLVASLAAEPGLESPPTERDQYIARREAVRLREALVPDNGTQWLRETVASERSSRIVNKVRVGLIDPAYPVIAETTMSAAIAANNEAENARNANSGNVKRPRLPRWSKSK